MKLTLESYADCLITSGAIQKGVPTNVFLLFSVSVSCPATPKSASFTSPLSDINTLAAKSNTRTDDAQLDRENFPRDISQKDWSGTSDDLNILWADWKANFFDYCVNSHAPIKTKRVRSGKVWYLGSHQTCGKVCVMVMLPNGKLLSLTILKTGLCTKGYIIRSMEKLNYQGILLRYCIYSV